MVGFLDSGGTYTTIDPPGSTQTIAQSINTSGQIVGYYIDGTNSCFLDSGGTYTTIDPPGSTTTSAQGINDSGQIVGYYFDGSAHGFLDSPVTVPAPTMLDAVSGHKLTTLSGIAEANSSVSIFDATKLIGNVTAARDGTWTLQTKVAAHVVHSYTETSIDGSGNTASSTGVTLFACCAPKRNRWACAGEQNIIAPATKADWEACTCNKSGRGERLMKSRLLAAVAIGAVFLVAPASAQVKIGILNDQSRVYADSGGKYSLEAARMAVEDFGGEVLGQKIEIVTADHQNKPDLATAIARRWYDTEGVDMITELTTSSVALAVQELSKEKKKIDIVVGAATSRITGDACTPYSFHWAYDTRALAVGTGGALVESGGDTWFFLTADYAFGYALEKDTRDIVTSKGGKVLGSVRVPLNSSDFSSFLLQAQNSKAKIIGLANAGLDTTNSIKQAAEFGIFKGGQKLAGLLMTISEVNGLGLEAAQGLILTEGFYWDHDDKSRAFAERFIKRTGHMPSMIHAGTYSATLSYLKAVKAAGTKDTEAVTKKLKELPVDDAFAQGKVLENGRMVHDLYLFEVKKPSESKKPWDYYKQIAVVPGDKAFFTAKESGCPLTK